MFYIWLECGFGGVMERAKNRVAVIKLCTVEQLPLQSWWRQRRWQKRRINHQQCHQQQKNMVEGNDGNENIKLKWASVKLERTSSTPPPLPQCTTIKQLIPCFCWTLKRFDSFARSCDVFVCLRIFVWMCVLPSVFMRWVGWWWDTYTKYRRCFIASRMRFTFAMGKCVQWKSSLSFSVPFQRNWSEIVQTSGRDIFDFSCFFLGCQRKSKTNAVWHFPNESIFVLYMLLLQFAANSETKDTIYERKRMHAHTHTRKFGTLKVNWKPNPIYGIHGKWFPSSGKWCIRFTRDNKTNEKSKKKTKRFAVYSMFKLTQKKSKEKKLANSR